jgi:hypothetical protein
MEGGDAEHRVDRQGVPTPAAKRDPPRSHGLFNARIQSSYLLMPLSDVQLLTEDTRFEADTQYSGARYRQMERYAEAMERLSHAPRDQQIAQLKAYIESNNYFLARSAMAKLLRLLPTTELVPSLRRLVLTPHLDVVEGAADSWLCGQRR